MGAMRLLFALSLLLPLSAQAQVSTDDQSLGALKPNAPAAPGPAPSAPAARPKAKPAARPKPAHTVARPGARQTKPAVRQLGTVRMPAAPPANPVLAPPPFVMPAHAPPPPPPVPVRDDAGGVASAIPGGLRVTFGAGGSDLNPATLAAIRGAAGQAMANPATIISITAWAPGVADDPSTPRRLSLDRALAVRAVLINAGIASERIRAVAKGMADMADGPPDRADVLSTAGAK